MTTINQKPIQFRSDARPAPAVLTGSKVTAPALSPSIGHAVTGDFGSSGRKTQDPEIAAGHGVWRTPCQHKLETAQVKSRFTSERRKRLTAVPPVSQFAEKEIWV